MSDPLVSVIIPTFNRAALLRRAVDSVLAQTLTDWECIIVDDGSNDATTSVLAELRAKDARIVTHGMGRRSGNTLARLAACRLARGEFLAILDDDDWWEPSKLQRQITALQAAPRAAWSYHAAQLVSPAGKSDVELVRHHPDFLQRLVQYNWLRHSSMVFRRSAIDAVGGYDQGLRLASDWDLVLRLTMRFGEQAIVTLPDLLVNYWLHPENISTNTALRTRAERRLVRRALLREGMLWKKPGLALRMFDRQLDREMHCALAEGRAFRAFGASLLSAMARPFRGWRWRRAGRFASSIFTRRKPGFGRSSNAAAPSPAPMLSHPAPAIPAVQPARAAESSDGLLRARQCDGPPILRDAYADGPARAAQHEHV